MIGLALVAAQLMAPPAPAVPSAAALALARLVADGPVAPASTRETEQAIVLRLLSTLGRRGPGCDPQLPACLQAAERIAREAAPAELAARQELYTQWLAAVIDATMTAGEIAEAKRFAATDAGHAFAGALLMLGMPNQMRPELRERLGRLMLRGSGVGRDDTALLDRFLDATASLPRRSLPIAPPAPLPPPAASKP